MLEKHFYANLVAVLANLIKIQTVQISAMCVFAALMPLLTISTASLLNYLRNLRAITQTLPFPVGFSLSESL